jgi:hypothetical protein
MLRAACSKPQNRQPSQLKEVAQAKASPFCASDGGEGQNEKDDEYDHPTSAASAGATTPEAETLLQPSESSGQQKEFEKSFQTALTVSHDSPLSKIVLRQTFPFAQPVLYSISRNHARGRQYHDQSTRTKAERRHGSG